MSARFVARALAMALLADARASVDARAWPALAARARQCLGLADPSTGLPAPLDAQLQHLARLPGREWQRLEVEDLATWLQHGVWRRQAGLPAAQLRADGGLIADEALDEEGWWPDADEGFDEPEDDEEPERTSLAKPHAHSPRCRRPNWRPPFAPGPRATPHACPPGRRCGVGCCATPSA